jgi:hypothetical protein
LTFHELQDSEKGKLREHGLEILRWTKCDKVGHQDVNGLQMRPGGTVSLPGCATQACFRLERPMPSVFAWFSLSWPKSNYKKGPLGVPKGWRCGDQKQINREIEGCRWRSLEGETLSKSPPVDSTLLWHVHHHQHLNQNHLDPPMIISCQTWCVVQSIVFPWSIVSVSKFE